MARHFTRVAANTPIRKAICEETAWRTKPAGGPKYSTAVCWSPLVHWDAFCHLHMARHHRWCNACNEQKLEIDGAQLLLLSTLLNTLSALAVASDTYPSTIAVIEEILSLGGDEVVVTSTGRWRMSIWYCYLSGITFNTRLSSIYSLSLGRGYSGPSLAIKASPQTTKSKPDRYGQGWSDSINCCY